MSKATRILWVLFAFLAGCQQYDAAEPEQFHQATELVVRLHSAEYDGTPSRSDEAQQTSYDQVAVCVVDAASGSKIEDTKSLYNPETSEIRIEGLHAGDYRLLLLGIRGDAAADGATIHPISHADDEWLSFPSDLQRPLEAEYFYSQTPFSVVAHSGALTVNVDQAIVQRRVIGRTDFTFAFNNPYVETSQISKRVTLIAPHFRTGLTGSGTFVGSSDGLDITMDLDASTSYLFPPTVDDEELYGEVEIKTRNYRGITVRRTYDFSLSDVSPNHIGHIHTPVEHPDDSSTTIYVTEDTFDYMGIDYILQDDEPKEVYTDAAQRTFNTAAPLQVSITDESKLHVRFYSPRDLSDVLIQVQIPSVSEEYFDLAYFDRVPAFADFFGELPAATHTTFCRTESGRVLELNPISAEQWSTAKFRIQSVDPYWAKLQAITHGWTIGFDLYQGDPDREDGGPVSNWMGIRPVHCREVVALFLNFTYMIDMPEHEEILRANEDRLYGNGGVNDKVTVETVLRQMRQPRNLRVGLVYSGNGVVGLGGGSAFGAYQTAWFEHYFNTYSCEIMFHELGHVMGYNHSSAFTYGPWANTLMNNFYVQHISEMPIDSPKYLDSRNNPHKYSKF